jgi:hypothetical protein
MPPRVNLPPCLYLHLRLHLYLHLYLFIYRESSYAPVGRLLIASAQSKSKGDSATTSRRPGPERAPDSDSPGGRYSAASAAQCRDVHSPPPVPQWGRGPTAVPSDRDCKLLKCQYNLNLGALSAA